jgi:3-phenylpropionate/trans-cinnamate dioxygenase ferredoxin reductase subunit
MPLETIVVVGGSLAGIRCAEALRRRGFSGRLVFVSAERERPYDRPPLSKELLRGDREPDQIRLNKPDAFDGLALDLKLGVRAESLDLGARVVMLQQVSRSEPEASEDHQVVSRSEPEASEDHQVVSRSEPEASEGHQGREMITYDGLVIATGAAARPLPGAPALAGVFTLRTLDDALALRADLARGPRVVVVGAGFIGAEVAATCRRRGLDVVLVEPMPAPMARVLAPEIGAVCASAHRDQGVDLRLGVGVAGLIGGERVERVRLSDGSEIPADVVVVGIGATPATDWLASSGLELGDGVICDATCATRAPGVVAAGDVARWYHEGYRESVRIEHWTNAVEQADAAAARLLDGPGAPAFAPIPFVWSDQYDLKIQAAGRLAPDDEVFIAHGSLVERRFVALFGRKGVLTGALAINRVRQLMGYRRMMREGATFEAAVAAARAE